MTVSMKTCALLPFILLVLSQPAKAGISFLSFVSLPKEKQDFIVSRIVQFSDKSSIMVMQPRFDELFRSDAFDLPQIGNDKYTIDMRWIERLWPSPNDGNSILVRCILPDYQNPSVLHTDAPDPPPYSPEFLSQDNIVRIVFGTNREERVFEVFDSLSFAVKAPGSRLSSTEVFEKFGINQQELKEQYALFIDQESHILNGTIVLLSKTELDDLLWNLYSRISTNSPEPYSSIRDSIESFRNVPETFHPSTEFGRRLQECINDKSSNHEVDLLDSAKSEEPLVSALGYLVYPDGTIVEGPDAIARRHGPPNKNYSPTGNDWFDDWPTPAVKEEYVEPPPDPRKFPGGVLPGNGIPGTVSPYSVTADLQERLSHYGLKALWFQRADIPEDLYPYNKSFCPTNALPFLLFRPEKVRGGNLPLVVYFGGWGEMGTDLRLQFQQSAVFDQICNPEFQKRHPCALFAPMLLRRHHAVGNGPGDPSPAQQLVCDAMYAAIRMLGPGVVDTNRIYVTGLSYGGRVSWSLPCSYPGRFAASVPVSAYSTASGIPESNAPNVWLLHNRNEYASDSDRREFDELRRTIEAGGGELHETSFPDTGHDAWHAAWREMSIWDWMFSKTANGELVPDARKIRDDRGNRTVSGRCSASVPGIDDRHEPRFGADAMDATCYISFRPVSKGDWWQIDYDSPVRGRFTILTGTPDGKRGLARGRVETSADGKTWSRVANFSQKTGTAQFSVTSPVRFLRILPEPVKPETLVIRDVFVTPQ
jgi:hypothetical protein